MALVDLCAANLIGSIFLAFKSSIQQLIKFAKLPRYARVNTLKTSVECVIDSLISDGFKQVEYDSSTSYETYLEIVKELDAYEFIRDMHVTDLLVFNPRENLLQHSLYENGHLILQDKSSCLPPIILKPIPGKIVLDACAAPGMKTTHLAALMNNDGILLASDQDEERIKEMKKILNQVGVTCAQVRRKDFTSINPKTKLYNKVRYILLDPSCSGTGMYNDRRRLNLDRSDISEDRLKNLAVFQKKMLLHALSFPKVKRVVYSTCSIHAIENEEVISFAVEKYGDRFKLEPPGPSFPFRGKLDKKYRNLNNKFLKLDSKKDLTNGFFVASFKRRISVKSNEKSCKDDSLIKQQITHDDVAEKECQHTEKKIKLSVFQKEDIQ